MSSLAGIYIYLTLAFLESLELSRKNLKAAWL